MLLYMVADGNRRGYRHVLRAFWDEAKAHGLPLPTEEPISAASFCEARQKFPFELLRDLLAEIAWAAPVNSEQRQWKGRRVFAVDGTWINLQRSPELFQAFGKPPTAFSPQLHLSVLVDVCGRVPMDFEIGGCATNEREQLSTLMRSLDAGDLVLLDRGYASYEVLENLISAGVDFLARIQSQSTFLAVMELQRRRGKDEILEMVPSRDPKKRPFRVRCVAIDGKAGECSYYLTSLSRSQASRAEIAALYRMRWEVEEFFKLLKSSYIGQGQYRSRSADGARQEIGAFILFLAIARLSATIAAEGLDANDEMPSQKGAVLAFAAFLTRILLEPDARRAREHVQHLLERISETLDKRRPGRSFPRRSFKPTPKWVPSGRRGA